MKAGDLIRVIGPPGDVFLGEEGEVLRVRKDGFLRWRPHLWGHKPLWIDPRNVVLLSAEKESPR